MSKGVVTFTESESEFLSESMLGRVATVSPNLEPHVVPVTFEFDGQYIYFSGYNLSESLKFHNLEQNNRVAFVVDDLVSVKPWRGKSIQKLLQESNIHLVRRAWNYIRYSGSSPNG